MAENKKNTRVKQNKYLPMVIVAGIVILAGVLSFAIFRNNNVYHSYKVLSETSRGDDTSASYKVLSDGMIKYSKDGVAFTDKDGTVIWNQTYEMTTPSMVNSEQYVAIGDIDGNDIYIFDKKGQEGHMTTNIPIQQIAVSDNGVVAAILSDASETYIDMYDFDGTKLITIKASLDNTGYPMAVALSEDATSMTAAYLTLKEGSVRTKLVFYDFSDKDDNQTKAEIVLDGLYTRIFYMESTKVAVIGEQGFYIYTAGGSIGSDVAENTSAEFDEEIQSIVEIHDNLGFIFRNTDDSGKYRMELYDLSGKLTRTISFDIDYTDIYTDDDEIILYNANNIQIYTYSGRLKFDGSSTEDIEMVLPSWSTNQYWLITEQMMDEIELK